LISELVLASGRARARTLDQYMKEGLALWKQGDPAGARAFFEQALRLHPRFPPALMGMFNVCLRRGRYEDAAVNLAAAMRVDPQSAPQVTPAQSLEVAYTVAMAEYKLGEFEAAEKAMREIVNLRPDSWQPRMHLGLVLLALDRYAEAKASLLEAVKIDSEAVPAYNVLAECCLRLNNKAEAKEALEKSLRLKPDQPKTRETLDALAKKTGEETGDNE
jgi:tetratricopeptide (TPR) repeat protein